MFKTGNARLVQEAAVLSQTHVQVLWLTIGVEAEEAAQLALVLLQIHEQVAELKNGKTVLAQEAEVLSQKHKQDEVFRTGVSGVLVLQLVLDLLQVQEQLLVSKKGVAGVSAVHEDWVLLHLHAQLFESKSGRAPEHDFAVLLHVQEQVLGSRNGVSGVVAAHITSVLSQKQEHVA